MTNINDIVYEQIIKGAALRVHAALLTDMDTGEIVYTSDLADQVFGYDRGELVGQKIEAVVPDAVREKHVGYRNEFAKSPRARPMGHGMVLFGKRKDGALFPVQVSLSDIDTTASLKRRFVVAFAIDLTEPVKTAVRIKDIVESGEVVDAS